MKEDKRKPVRAMDRAGMDKKKEELLQEMTHLVPRATCKANEPILNEDQKLDLVSKLALYWKIPKIISYFRSIHNLELSEMVIYQYKKRKEWALVIDRMRTEYVAGIMEVPIANKRWRMEQYEDIYHLLREAGKDAKAAEILNLARQEMEEKKGNIQNLYMTQINVTDEELMQEKLKSLNELESIRKRKQLALGGKSSAEISIEQSAS